MPSVNPSKPNIIVILTDDQGAWAMGCAGNREIRTPHLDQLAETGIHFTNFFCTSPVSSPARASVLTGRIPSQHGVHDWLCAGNCVSEPLQNGKMIEYLKDQPAYTDLLAAAGYDCGISGKWHLGDCDHPQKSFAYWRVHTRGGGNYNRPSMVVDSPPMQVIERYVTDLITDNAIDFLQRQAGHDAPFCLNVHYTAPHSPWDRGQHPEHLFNDYYDHCPFESAPDEPIHPWANNFLTDFFESPEKRREKLSGYYAAVTAMDAGVGRILEYLEANNLRENTLILFLSDNGMNMGHHGICGKGNGTLPMNMYDTSVKVPALISQPGHALQGLVCDHLLSQYDWFPTLLDYLGIDNPHADALPGRSFADLLRGDESAERDSVVVYDEYGPVRMIRDHHAKYIHRYPDGPNEFYDLDADPDERNNLIDSADHAQQIDAMRQQLQQWFDQYVDRSIDGAKLPVTGAGQKDLADVSSDGLAQFEQKRGAPWWRTGYEPPAEK